jgi:phosphoenolpyruvate carboxylase
MQRRSIMDCEREIARLLQWRDRSVLTPEETAEFETKLYRLVLSLWQTAMLRLTKLKVTDEIKNGLQFYRRTFLPEVPRLYLAFEDGLRQRYGFDAHYELPNILTVGSWVGSDRDGNGAVNAETLLFAVTHQASEVLAHYLEQLHVLRSELAISSRLQKLSDAVWTLAASAQDENPQRNDEPYRRALLGMYARLAATAKALVNLDASPAAHKALPPYKTPAELLDDLRVLRDSLCAHGAEKLALGRLIPLMRTVQVFGFHLAALDVRQNSFVHEKAVAELLAKAAVEPAYLALSEEQRVTVLTRELQGPRPLYCAHLAYSAVTMSELGVAHAAADVHRRFGATAVPNYIISNCQSLSDLLEVAILIKEAGLLLPTLSEGGTTSAANDSLQMNIIPLFETIADLRNGASVMKAALSLPLYRSWLTNRGSLQVRNSRKRFV